MINQMDDSSEEEVKDMWPHDFLSKYFPEEL